MAETCYRQYTRLRSPRYHVSGMNLRLTLHVGLAAVTLWLLAACDEDPTQPDRSPLSVTVVTPDTVARQGSIRVLFGSPVDPATALDPANFIVINQCTGLRVPGALRLAGDTLIFSPSQALPFLTLLGVRVQNILDLQGRSLANPITFSVITEAPPVTDVSWEFLNSPTSGNVTGVSFVNRNVGYLLANDGSLYRTTNGGLTFAARFKDVDISSTFGIRAFGLDTAFMLGSFKEGATSRFALFRTVNAGLSFDTVGTSVTPFVTVLSMTRDASGHAQGVFGGQSGGPRAFRYTSPAETITEATGLPSGSIVFTGIALSNDASHAVVTGLGFSELAGQGFAYRSTDGGLSYTSVTLPADVFGLLGAGFINDTEALVLGDSSVILRVNAATGEVVRLGAAEGVPQTELVAETQTRTAYSFTRAHFVPGSPIGWVIGRFRRQRPNTRDIVGGVILMSRDAGRTFTRQAVADAPGNGLDFPLLIDVQALAPDFAVAGGSAGFVTARKSDVISTGQACSFTTP